ncbi:MAG: hypothetical protein COW24_00600 [Candidatus Kerfeldbacteria bacterium CG15_BIG_FIL_POST_REV_8_21_14_020_45_12]|uniref:Multidrug ABC transporter substrate-binding protein n=1 Tax=Candidatus Kerfeldbacteria bacterium CG15_BIG_FIL_POST_REV_8_21_14_020_45_12 TaxID=2014247 RepID=A0A2M7H555_9BACT|nr:MAG: hypothetical protein COW24_00600 [Candidatus Kerfeldbacteria bacterium CG15_BIG_FIL_POST_REV_8_21_14_020_45_12]PJA94080.1 MAG: hypothetical protein CO132_00080 [Candidatus Kerfeldbacteria bacterium CG_4_9_14_3_um_filter_45_8]
MTMVFVHIKTALEQLIKNKGRSVLTMLGIIIGIGSVIFILTVGEVAKNFLIGQISQFGTNVVEVSPQSAIGLGEDSDATTLTDDKVDQIEHSSLLPEITAISAGKTLIKDLQFENTTKQISIYADRPDIFPVNNQKALRGRIFNQSDFQSGARVLVIGQNLEKDLFEGDSAVGKKVKVGGVLFQIIGVVEGFDQFGGGFGPDMVFAPLTTIRRLFIDSSESNTISFMLVQFESGTNVDSFTSRLNFELRRVNGYNQTEDFPFYVASREQFLSIFDTVLLGVQAFISAVAGISLFVGGIGIMNIMLVTVKERTKEIGLRKAIGAKNESILTQFLVESIVLTTVGGIIGIAMGLSLTLLSVVGINYFQPDWGVAFIIVPQAIFIACGVSVTVGMIFGLYPAFKASKLHPIEALRYE